MASHGEFLGIKYFIYARKSQEGDEKQAQSIPDQLRENEAVAKRYGIKTVGVLTEEGSAKEPNKRPIFEEMLERIKKGESNGIICWNLNRLSRNPVDSGKLQWMLQQGLIQSILTPSREYKPTDNAIIFSVESGSANQFILDMKVGVRRGLNSKIAKGQAPILAPLGYLNTKHEVRGENYITKDNERFDLIKKAWKLMLTGEYTIPKLLKVMNNDWGIRTRKTRHRGGNPVNKSTMYGIFTNIFYTGMFLYRGVLSNGKHEPMITTDEFDKVQMLLGKAGKPRKKTHAFAYTGTMLCGECGSSITACEKTKLVKSTNELKDYTFYYCSHRKQGTENCTQRSYIPVDDLETMIKTYIDKYTISEKFRDWALKILQEEHSEEAMEREAIYKSQLSALDTSQRELDSLITMRMRELINDEQYGIRKKELTERIVILKQKVTETQSRANNWLQHTERVFDFAHTAKTKFEDPKTTLDEKKGILMELGWNHTIKDKKLLISQCIWLEPIAEKRKAVESEISRLELEKLIQGKTKHTSFEVCPVLRGLVDEVGTAVVLHYMAQGQI
ncbi:MAG: recombinase family protein [bacterium]|nr:recombinase family protein [bacterium]